MFEVNEIAAVDYGRSRVALPVRVVKISPKGMVTVSRYPGETYIEAAGHITVPVIGAYKPSRWSQTQYDTYGTSHAFGGCLRKLAPGETAEGLIAAAEAKAKADAAALDAAKAKKVAEVAAWWTATGKAIWDARLTIAEPFLGKTVCIIRFSRGRETRLAFVIAEQSNDWNNKTEYSLQVGGLCGYEYEVAAGEKRTSISTYSNGNINKPTLEECLFSACN